ncbi:hypothetical protein F511_14663 [Dorcoceras hygrometricum]|uniref:CCHC-type domain-containing protein n=1 Tax=Dorcoceras hygrometricum TaxID=472368 RepID=A0A2Z7BS67_9LAMI|nr:hypothetical protein F511_14663 [Dorcoceras hygrometricum]
MTSREDVDVDDDFSELYKAYTGPLGSNANNAPNAPDNTATNKRSRAGSDEEEGSRDPNAVPTDFTSREAKVWEAKSKATEKNWKKRKEEEMICKICGESGHFTQGCPSTLGANRKSQDFFERVPARDPHVKALFSEKVVNKVEKDIGCKIKIEEKFIIVSGKDRLILKKGVDAVHKIKEEGEYKGIYKLSEEAEPKVSSGSPISWSRLPERRSPASSRFGRTDSQKSHPRPYNSAHNTHKYGRPDKFAEDRVREDLLKLSSGSPQASGNDGGRGRATRSKSPAHPSYIGNSYNSFDGHSQNRGGYRTDGWNLDKGEADLQLSHNVDHSFYPRTLEELELQCKKEAVDLARLRDKEEDEENYRHREAVKEMRESHIKNVAMLKDTHAKMWEEFLQLQDQRRQHHERSRVPVSGFGGYKQPSFRDFNNSTGNLHHAGPSVSMDSRSRYQSSMESYPSSRPPDSYDEVQHHRRDDFGKAYNRY